MSYIWASEASLRTKTTSIALCSIENMKHLVLPIRACTSNLSAGRAYYRERINEDTLHCKGIPQTSSELASLLVRLNYSQ